MYQNELYHYGVVGMKWGVHRARRKQLANERLRVKAVNYDKKAAKLSMKSEKAHAKYDLKESNKIAIKAQKYKAKAAKVSKRALNTDDEMKRNKLEYKSEKLKLKSAKAMKKANELSKSVGYGDEAMKYSIKSDKVAIKAAKARKKIARNAKYIETMNKRMSEISKDTVEKGLKAVNATPEYWKKHESIVKRYEEKKASAKTEAERDSLEFDMLDEIDSLDERYGIYYID